MKFCRSPILLLLMCGLGTGDSMAAAPDEEHFFETKIRPILVERCYDCHGPDSAEEGNLRVDSLAALLKGGNTGPAIKPNQPSASLLIDAVNHGKLYQMPPKSKLPASEIASLTRWVEMGAPWPDSEALPASASPQESDAIPESAREFWAFRSPVLPPIPTVRDEAWPKSPIDHFILAGLEAKHLKPAVAADRRALIRRATFDLIGLPPTPAEIQDFLADRDPDAFAKVIDRLLRSPHYGERWGRHWLDVARYADSNGMDENLAFVSAWRYRDYVIDAFNHDLPYDQFVREQLAGDLLPADTHAERVRRQTATAFLSLGPKMLAEDDPVKMQMDIVDEQIDTVGRTFLGLTLACARCHDHKFDPIPTSDYYGLAGIFKSTKTMENFKVVAVWHERPVPTEAEQQAYNAHQAKLTAARRTLEEAVEEAAAKLRQDARQRTPEYLAAALELIEAEKMPQLMKPFLTEGDATPPNVLFVEAESFDRGNVQVDTTNYGAGIGVILNRGEQPNFVEYDIEIAEAGAYQLELRYAAAEARPVRITLDRKLLRSEAANSDTGSWTAETQTWFAEAASTLTPGVHTIRIERNGPFPHFDKIALVPWPASEGPIPRTAEQIADEQDLCLDFVRGWAKYLNERSLNASEARARFEQLTAMDGWETATELSPDLKSLRDAIFDPAGPLAIPADSFAVYSATQRTKLEALKNEVEQLEKSTPQLPHAMGVTDGKIEDIPIHFRGSHLTLASHPVPRRFPRVLAGEEQSPLSPATSGRAELADWLTQPEHPLTARVMVNRIWRWHFGAGIVRSTDNFGQLGDPPTNQPLLDWLALQFVESGWSIKALHRMIMLSSTYQMSTSFDSRSAEIDPENRLHWRMNRRRLEAEAIRDALLAVSDSLDPTMGGTLLSCKPREYVAGTASVNKTNYTAPRRSVYLPVIRSALFETFQAFDFADPSTQNGDRPTTTVAPQALFMMNSPLMMSASHKLADQLLAENADDRGRVELLYERGLGRLPTQQEVERGLGFLDRCQAELARQEVAAEEQRVSAWQSLCRVIFSSSEFIHLE